MKQQIDFFKKLVHFKTTLDKDRNKKLEILYKMFLEEFKPEELEQSTAVNLN